MRPYLSPLHTPSPPFAASAPTEDWGGGVGGNDEKTAAGGNTEVRRVKPGHFAQVDGLHGFFQMGLDVPPQFVRVRLFGCRPAREEAGRDGRGDNERQDESLRAEAAADK